MKLTNFVMLLGIGLVGLASLPAGEPEKKGLTLTRLTHDGSFKQHLAWSPDGKKLLLTRLHAGKMGLWWLEATGSELKPIFQPNTPHFDGSWSPDSTKIIFVLDILQGTDGKLQINTINADGTDPKTLIPHKAFDESPRWSPDGKTIAWVSTREGNQEIYTVDAEGKNQKRLTSEVAFDNNPSWSPDSKQLVFASSRHGNFEICALHADGSNFRRLTQNQAMDYWPVWSPDGKTIAFTSNRDGNYDIYLMNPDGSQQRNLTQHPSQDNFAAWSPDSKRIAFISNRDKGWDVYVANAP